MAENKKTKAQEAKEAEAAEQEQTKKEEENEEAAEAQKETGELAQTSMQNLPDMSLAEMGLDIDDFDDVSGTEHLDSSDMSIPYAKLYSKRQNGYEVGNFVLPDGQVIDGKDGEELTDISILSIRKTRVMFPENYKAGNTFICRSFNNIEGAPDGAYPGQPCATCEFSKFPEGGGAPPCSMQYLLLCTSKNVKLFHVIISGIGVSEFKKKFASTEMQRGLSAVRKALGVKDPKFRFIGGVNINMKVGEKDTEYGPFPYLHFYVNRDQPVVDAETFQENREAAKMYKDFEEDSLKAAAHHTASQEDMGGENVGSEGGGDAEEDAVAEDNPNQGMAF